MALGETESGGRVARRVGPMCWASWKREMVGGLCHEERREVIEGAGLTVAEVERRAKPSVAALIERSKGTRKEGAACIEKSINPKPPMDVGR